MQQKTQVFYILVFANVNGPMYTEAGSENISLETIEYRSDDLMAFCYSIVMVPNKRSLHQASGSGLEPGTCIVSNHCDH